MPDTKQPSPADWFLSGMRITPRTYRILVSSLFSWLAPLCWKYSCAYCAPLPLDHHMRSSRAKKTRLIHGCIEKCSSLGRAIHASDDCWALFTSYVDKQWYDSIRHADFTYQFSIYPHLRTILLLINFNTDSFEQGDASARRGLRGRPCLLAWWRTILPCRQWGTH